MRSSVGSLLLGSLLVLASCALVTTRAAAQSEPSDADAIDPSEVRVLPADPCERLTLVLSALDRREARASCLASVRLADRQDRIDEGVVLFGFGLLGSVAGGVTTAIGVSDDDTRMLAVGVSILGFSLLDAALSSALFDLSGERLRAIEADRVLGDEALLEAEERAASAQDATASWLALHTGLDALYVATGALLYVLGTRASPEDPWLVGLGLTAVVEGGLLLVYDGVTWAFAAERAGRLRTLLRDATRPHDE